MAVLSEANYRGKNNAILITLASICVGVWIAGLGLLCGIVRSLTSPELYQLGLLAFAAGFVGVLTGFVASIPSPMKHGGEKVELEGGMVSETGKWVSSAIAGGSLTAIALKGKEFLVWLAESLNQSEGVVFLTIILFAVLGFLIMYFARRIVLNVVLADSRNELEARLRDIKIVNEWMPMTLVEPLEKIPDEIHDAVERLTSDKIEMPLQEYEGLLAQGIALKLKGNLRASIDYLERAGKANPTDYRPLAVLASTYYDMGDIREAYTHISRAEELRSQELDPGYLKVYAQISYAAHEHKKAIEYYSQYLKMHPGDSEARFRLATAYAKYGVNSDNQEAYDNAITALDVAVQRDSSLKSKAIEEMREGGSFECLSSNDRFKRIVGTAQEQM